MPYYWKWLLERGLDYRAYICGKVGFQIGNSLKVWSLEKETPLKWEAGRRIMESMLSAGRWSPKRVQREDVMGCCDSIQTGTHSDTSDTGPRTSYGFLVLLEGWGLQCEGAERSVAPKRSFSQRGRERLGMFFLCNLPIRLVIPEARNITQMDVTLHEGRDPLTLPNVFLSWSIELKLLVN